MLTAAYAVTLGAALGVLASPVVAKVGAKVKPSTTIECDTADCKQLAHFLTRTMDTKADPCKDFHQFVCGHYDQIKDEDFQFRPDTQQVTWATSIQHQLEATVKGILKDSDKRLQQLNDSRIKEFRMLRRYYDTCMDLREATFERLEPFLVTVDLLQQHFQAFDPPLLKKIKKRVSAFLQTIYQRRKSAVRPNPQAEQALVARDYNALRHATVLLSQYRLWAFASIVPAPSLFNGSVMTVRIAPHTPGLPQKDLYDDPKIVKEYHRIMTTVLNQAYYPPMLRNPRTFERHRVAWTHRISKLGKKFKEWWRISDRDRSIPFRTLAQRVIEMERQIHNILPKKNEYKEFKDYVVNATLDDLNVLGPAYLLKEVVLGQGNLKYPKYFNSPIEVLYPDFFKQLSKILYDLPKSTIRAFFVWQMFVQWHDLVEDKVTSIPYRAILRRINGLPEREDRSDYCRRHVLRHFGPVVASFFLEKTWDADMHNQTENMFYGVRKTFIDEILKTPWLDKETKRKAVAKAIEIDPSIGYRNTYPDPTNPFHIHQYFLGSDIRAGIEFQTFPDVAKRWPHFGDYVAFEKWYVRKSWTRDFRRRPPWEDMWTVGPWDPNAYYLGTENKVILPVALSRYPFLSTKLPLWASYAGLGALVGHEIGSALGPDGCQFHGNRTLGECWTHDIADAYEERASCFKKKYDGLSVVNAKEKVVKLDGDFLLGEVMADTHGADVAHAAWKVAQHNEPVETIAELKNFTPDQLFWITRSAHFCSLERGNLLESYLQRAPETPPRVRTWAPMQDSYRWHKAFQCKQKDPICRIWGDDEKYSG